MKKIILGSFLVLSVLACNSEGVKEGEKPTDQTEKKEQASEAKGVKIEQLNKDSFKQLVFDYEKDSVWKFQGNMPVIVDFYADWCRPCKMVAPILEELQQEYKGKIQIYKVNTQYEQELASVFQITGIPAFLFIPATGQPAMMSGALPKETFKQYIKEILKVN